MAAVAAKDHESRRVAAGDEKDSVPVGATDVELNNPGISREKDIGVRPIKLNSEDFEEVQGTTVAQTVFNIVKNVVGEGMLSLPAGLAAGTGLFIGCLIAALFGSLTGYTFALMGRVCHKTKTTNHKDAALAVNCPALAQAMAIILMCKTAFTCTSYAIVIGESYASILHYCGIYGFLSIRQVVLLIVMVVILLPLCLQRDLSILSYTSLFGIACEVFVVAFMQWRLLDGSYEFEGRYWDSTKPEYRVDFGTPEEPHMWNVTVTTFVLVATLCTAFLSHYNAPKFYSQMKDRSPQKFTLATVIAFSVSFIIYAWIMTVGYLTFGANCDGLILNNYSEEDPGATLARIAIGFAVLFGFPLTFTALRDSTLSTLDLPAHKKRFFIPVTLTLLVIISVLGCILDDIGIVNSLGGAIFGSAITLVFPGLLFVNLVRHFGKDYQRIRETKWANVVVLMGMVLIVFGAVISVLKKYAPHVLRED